MILPKLKKNGDTKNSLTKTVMAKRLTEAVVLVGGIVNYIGVQPYEKQEMINLYVGLINFMGADTTERSRTKLAMLAAEEVEAFYLKNFLKNIPAHFLRTICTSVKIWHGDCTSSNILADCLINGKNYKPSKSYHVSQPSLKKKPKSIKDGISKPDLIYWFTLIELKEFCDEKGLRNSGKKSELAERILNFFNPDKENDVKGAKKKGRKGRKKKMSRTPIEEAPAVDQTLVERPSKKNKVSEITHEPEKMDLDSDSEESSF